MTARTPRFLIGLLAVFIFGALALAQVQPRDFFKKPETPREFWEALKFEVEVGKYDLAAAYLKGFLASMPSEDELLKIEDQEGLSAFIKLRTIPKWLDDPKLDKDTKVDVETLIETVTKALQTKLSDPQRIKKFIRNLSATREERIFAVQQLYRSGALAVPYLINSLRKEDADSPEHAAVLSALPKLGPRIVPPLLAALEINEPVLRLEVIDTLLQLRATEAVPYLWPLTVAPKEEAVRKAAYEVILQLTGTDPKELPTPKAALTHQAERYYDHKVPFAKSEKETVWTWTGEEIASQEMTHTQAEEYYGLFFARKALELDPTYVPAQSIFLSLALEKGFERAGLDQPLSKAAPSTRELALSVNPELLSQILDQALVERRPAVIIGAARALGELHDAKAALPSTQGPSPLVRALNYPDRRVQLAVADALLRTVGSPQPVAGYRIVDILRRNLAAAQTPKALVIDFNKDRGEALARALKQAGFEVGADEIVQTGRAGLRRLAVSADIEAIFVDVKTVDPDLPYLIAQLRADINVGLLPVLVLTGPDRGGPATFDDQLRLRRLLDTYRNVWLVPGTTDPAQLKALVAEKTRDFLGLPLSEAERKDAAADSILWLARMARGEAAGYDIRPAQQAILAALRSNDLALLAIEAAGGLPGAAAQRDLASLALDGNRDAKLRSAAAFELSRHVQKNGVFIGKEQISALQTLYAMTMAGDEAKLKSNLALVLGSLRPDARLTGERLQAYVPPPPVAPAEKKEPEKKEEKKEEK